MKVRKGQSQPQIVAEIRLSSSLHGSGFTIFVPIGFDCDSNVGSPAGSAEPDPMNSPFRVFGKAEA